ncbi:phosphoribosylglycinamide formyltransferase [Paenibacillus sp. y28]|uniref:phosphoribosylglycinamide formyltransferase n=1 Tax=Paenibacillus sp. y28 TaxID=3129110 RepID=UPI0030165696
MSTLRIAVFASGSGSNFQALTDAVQEGKLDARIELLVCDRPQARVVSRAEAAGIPVLAFRPKDYADKGGKAAYEQEIVAQLQSAGVELVVLAGYMRIVGETLLDAYRDRIINLHPSLLPSFPGLDAIGQALAHGVKVTGITVHVVDGGMDTGPIIAQRAVEVLESDDAEALAARIHQAEHELLPQAVQLFCEKRVQVDGRRVIIDK